MHLDKHCTLSASNNIFDYQAGESALDFLVNNPDSGSEKNFPDGLHGFLINNLRELLRREKVDYSPDFLSAINTCWKEIKKKSKIGSLLEMVIINEENWNETLLITLEFAAFPRSPIHYRKLVRDIREDNLYQVRILAPNFYYPTNNQMVRFVPEHFKTEFDEFKKAVTNLVKQHISMSANPEPTPVMTRE